MIKKGKYEVEITFCSLDRDYYQNHKTKFIKTIKDISGLSVSTISKYVNLKTNDSTLIVLTTNTFKDAYSAYRRLIKTHCTNYVVLYYVDGKKKIDLSSYRLIGRRNVYLNFDESLYKIDIIKAYKEIEKTDLKNAKDHYDNKLMTFRSEHNKNKFYQFANKKRLSTVIYK